MKEIYHSYYKFTEDELIDIWKDCIFAVDANVMLRLYRYTEGKETLIKVFDSIKERLFIPHQASMEYHERLKEKIFEQKLEYSRVSNDIKKNFNELKAILSTKRLNLTLNNFSSELGDIENKIIQHIDEKKETHPDLEKFSLELATLFSGKVGQAYTQDELDEIYTSGTERYAKRIPPGFGDLKEKEKRPPRYVDGLKYIDVYGDLVMWNQMIDEANSNETSGAMVFITEDVSKGDWIELYKDTKLKMGAHPALRQEFFSRTNGKRFMIYPIEEFLQASDKYLKDTNVDAEEVKKAIENVKEVELIQELYIDNKISRDNIKQNSVRIRNKTFNMQKLKAHLLDKILSQQEQETRIMNLLEYNLIELNADYTFNEKFEKFSSLQKQILLDTGEGN